MSTPYYCTRTKVGYKNFCLVKGHKVFVTEGANIPMNYRDWPEYMRQTFRLYNPNRKNRDSDEYILAMHHFAYKHNLMESVEREIIFQTFNEALDSYMTNIYQQSGSVFTTPIELEVGEVVSLDEWAVHWLQLRHFDIRLEAA